MKKITPNPPSTTLFTLAPDISPETLLIQASETLASLNAMTTDLAFELEGAHRHKLLATQQLIVLGELLVERVLVLTQDTQTFQQPKGRDAFSDSAFCCASGIPPHLRLPCSPLSDIWKSDTRVQAARRSHPCLRSSACKRRRPGRCLDRHIG